MPMTLQHYVKAARRKHPNILAEVRAAYEVLGQVSKEHLESEISEWTTKPTFTVKVTVTKRKWQILVKYDGRTVGGKRFNWVDVGTGERGPNGEKYPIRPKKAKHLRFEVPFTPPAKTPASGPTNQLPPGVYYSGGIMHPGIWPRHFIQRLTDNLKDRNKSGGFRSVTEAAVKRGLRK